LLSVGNAFVYKSIASKAMPSTLNKVNTAAVK